MRSITPKNTLACQLRQIKVALLATPTLKLLKQRCKYMFPLSEAPVKLSFTPPWNNSFLYSHTTYMESGYAAKAKTSVLAHLGIEWNMERPEIFVSSEEQVEAQDILERDHLADTPFIIVNPSHRREIRRGAAMYYAELLALFKRQHPHMTSFILYDPREKELAEAIAAQSGTSTCSPHEMLTLRQMAAVTERAVLLLSNCSTPRHFTVAINIPSFVILEATSPAWRFPNEGHYNMTRKAGSPICNENTCQVETQECLKELYPKDVFAELAPFVGTHLTRWRKRNG